MHKTVEKHVKCFFTHKYLEVQMSKAKIEHIKAKKLRNLRKKSNT